MPFNPNNLFAALCLSALVPSSAAAEVQPHETALDRGLFGAFLDDHCIRCHGPEKQKAKLRLDTLDFTISDKDEAFHYQDVLDALNAGEMPPEDEPQPTRAELEEIIGGLTEGLHEAGKRLASRGGRVDLRRLNRREYAGTIRHLFGFEPPLKEIPVDDQIENFDTVGSRQYFTSERFNHYYELGQRILETGFRWAGVREAEESNVQEPELFWNSNFRRFLEQHGNATEGKAVRLAKQRREYFALPMTETGVYLAEPLRHLAYGRSVDPRGTYRIRIKAGIHGEVQPFRRFIRVGIGREEVLAVFRIDGTTASPTESVVEVSPALLDGRLAGFVAEDRSGAWLSHYLNTLKHHHGVDPAGEGLLWIDSIAVEGPRYPEERSFFDALLCPDDPEPSTRSDMVWNDANAKELIARFAFEAFRRKQPPAEYTDGLAGYFQEQRGKGKNFTAAMVDTLAIILASPGFVYMSEDAEAGSDSGELSPQDTAIRLAYFLTSAPPDAALYEVVEAGTFSESETYHQEIHRLLTSPRQDRFAEGFGSQWADFVRLDSISVSGRFPTYNPGLLHSMKQEVITYFDAMIQSNLPVANLVRSDFATINAQLAVHYGLPGVTSNKFERISLPPESPRGGYLSQAAFLVAGSNGERTSPSIRGMILMNRFLNSPPPPPPPNVPELGAATGEPSTTRQLVELHQTQAQCASCHRKMDVLGLGLENFDVIGRWRDSESVGARDVPVEIAGTMPEGEAFEGFAQFQSQLLAHEEDLARNMIKSLLVYALGRDIEFTDLPQIEAIMNALRPDGFRMGDMIHAVADSPFFFAN